MRLSIGELKDVVANAKTSLEQYLALELIELKAERVPVAYTGYGSLAAIKGGHEGYIWGTSAEAHPIELYTTPQPAHTEQVIPDGWRLVPIEPTPGMMVEGTLVSEFEADPAGMYRAMIAAAPKPETE